MPELPEVETIVTDLRPRLQGRKVLRAEVSDPLLVRFPPKGQFEARLPGRAIEAISRRGKYIVIGLEGRLTWLIHLRMTGRLLLALPPGEAHARARFDLAGGSVLWYCDLRRFGDMWAWFPGEDANLGGFLHLGPEPLSSDFSARWLCSVAATRRTAVKNLLLDQRVVAGLGNIYADEALFAAGIHPGTPSNSLSLRQYKALCQAVKDVLQAAIQGRGTTFKDYRNGLGAAGGYQHSLQVYGRRGQLCLCCKTPLAGCKIGGRSTVYCPHCQRR